MTFFNQIYPGDSRDLGFIPANTVDLVCTSPMYWKAGMKYQGVTDVMPLEEYIDLNRAVWSECYRVIKPGGRICTVVANVGRKPYVRLDALHAELLTSAGFADRGSIIWDKGPVYGTAWGSWRRPTAPQLRDKHESILIFQKPGTKEGKGFGDMTPEEFCAATQSIWQIQPASAKKTGHPAPFPVELAKRIMRLYTYPGDIVLDPFLGHGATILAAEELGRQWIGRDIVPEYCELAETNIQQLRLRMAK